MRSAGRRGCVPWRLRRRSRSSAEACASIVAAYELTSTPELRERYDVTVYQLGWRLGGKGASGRNAEHGQRIEEHGLHIWFGFYENAFRVMRDAYEELGRQPGDAARHLARRVQAV